MKQSQNAITYLRSQYRAVYGRAYVKGLASAVLLSSALAPMVAQAATINGSTWDNATDATLKNGDTLGTTTQNNNKSFNKLSLANGANVTIDPSNSVAVKDQLWVTAGNTVNVTSSGSVTSWDPSQTTGYLNATGDLISNGTINLGSGTAGTSSIEVNRVELQNSSVTNIQGETHKAQATTTPHWTTNAKLVAGHGQNGELVQYASAQLNLNNSSIVEVRPDSTAKFDGTINFNATDQFNSAIIRGVAHNQDGAGTSADLHFNSGSTINVNSGSGENGIYAARTQFSQNTINVKNGGTLRLDGDFHSDISASHGQGYFLGDGATINIANGGRVIVGNGSNTQDPTNPDFNPETSKTTLALASNDSAASHVKGSGTLEVQGNLILTETILDEFVGTPNNEGHVQLSNGGRMEFIHNTEAVEVSDYTFAPAASAGTTNQVNADILISGTNNVVAADKLSVSKRITPTNTNVGDVQVNLESDELTLGGGTDFNSESSSLGFNTATTQNVTFKADADGSPFYLHDHVKLQAAQGDAEATSTGDVIIGGTTQGSTATGEYTVARGTVNHSGAMTLQGGKLIVGNQAAENSDVNQDAQLGLSQGSLVIDNSAGANTVVVSNNSNNSTSTLDLSNGTTADAFTIQRGNSLTTFKVGTTNTALHSGSSVLKVNTTGFNTITNANGESNLGANVLLQDNGVMEVVGSQDGTEQPTIDTSYLKGTGDIANPNTDQSDTIYFHQGGTLRADSLLLTDSQQQNINIGSGTIESNDLDLSQATGQSNAITLQAGNIQVNNSISSTDGTVTDLNVNSTSANSSVTALHLGSTTQAPTDGTVDVNVNLQSATDSSGAALNVKTGNWQLQNVTAQGLNSSINVGPSANVSVNNITAQNQAQVNLGQDSTLTVAQNGTGDFSQASVMGNGTLVGSQDSTVKLSTKSFDSLVGSNQTVQGKGHVRLEGSRLEVTGSTATNQLDLGKYTFSNTTGSDADVQVTAPSTVATEHMVIGQSLGTEVKDNLSVEAQNLTLGSNAFNSSAESLGVKQATATENLTFVSSGTATTDNYTLQDHVVLNGNAPSKTNNGTVSSKGNVAITNGTYQVAGGTATHSGNFTVAGGNLQVGLGTDSNVTAGSDATLGFDAGNSFTLDHSTADNTVSVVSTGRDDTTGKTGTSTLDLTNTTITVNSNANGTNHSTIQVGTGTRDQTRDADAVLLLKEDQLDQLLDTTGNAAKGVIVELAGNGEMQLSGTGTTTLDVAALGSGTAGRDQIVFNDGGTLRGNNLTITDSGNTGLNIGAGTLHADNKLELQASGSNPADFNVHSGRFEVGSELRSNASNINFGDGTNGAGLQLGEVQSDAQGTISHSADSGNVNTNLTFNGGTTPEQRAELNVEYGEWKVNGGTAGTGVINATNTNLTVGHGSYLNETSASLKVNDLNLSGSTAQINSNGSLHTNKLDLADTSMRVDGTVLADKGVTSVNGDQTSITVSGPQANFEFGKYATASQVQITNDTLTVNGVDSVFTLENQGNITLNFTAPSGKQFFNLTKEQIAQLRTELISGSTGEVLEDGYFHLKGASTDAINVVVNNDPTQGGDFIVDCSDSGNLAGLEDTKDIVFEWNKNATLTKVDPDQALDFSQIGNIKVNGSGDHFTINNGTLVNAKNDGSGSGDRLFATNESGSLVGANVTSGGRFELQNGGSLGKVTLDNGNSATDPTQLIITGQGFEGTDPNAETKISEVSGGANTVMVVNGITTVTQLENDATQGTGNVTVGTLEVNRDLTVSGAVTVDNLQHSANAATVGKLTANQLTVNNNTAFNGDMTINTDAQFAGNTTLGSNKSSAAPINIDVLNDATFSGNTTIEGNTTLNVGNKATFSGNTTFKGTGIFTTAEFSGDTTFNEGSNLTVNGTANFNGTTNLNGGTQQFNGDVTFSGTTTQLAAHSLDLSNTQSAHFSGTTELAGNNKFANTSFEGTTTLTGNNTFNGTGTYDPSTGQPVSGDNSFSGTTTLGGVQQVESGVVSFAGNTTQNQNAQLNAATGTTVFFEGDTSLNGTNTLAQAHFTGNTTLNGSTVFNEVSSFNSSESGDTTTLNGNHVFNADAEFDGTTVLDAGKQSFNESATFAGTTTQNTGNVLDATGGTLVEFNGTTTLNGQAMFNEVAFAGNTEIGGQLRADSAEVDGTFTVVGQNNSHLGNLVAADKDTLIQVGRDKSGNVAGQTGSLEIDNAVLNGATVFVDPEYGQPTALVAIASASGGEVGQSGSDNVVGTFDGNLVVGKNAALGVGSTVSELQTAIRSFQQNGSLQTNNPEALGAALYVQESMSVQNGNYIVVNASPNAHTLNEVTSIRDYEGRQADLALSDNSALVINKNAFSTGTGTGTSNSTAAITFGSNDALVKSEGGKIILTGSFSNKDALKIFDDAGGDGVELRGQNITVSTVSGLYQGEIQTGTGKGDVTLTLDEGVLDDTDISDPSKDLITRYPAGENPFLDDAINNDPKALDRTLNLAAFGGAPQTTLAVTQSINNAIATRTGVGQTAPSSSNLSKSNKRGGLWFTPAYAHIESDGFTGSGVDYGSDIDLYGVNAGAELALTPQLKVGALVSFGQGDTEGNGHASGVSNDFNYWGLGAYAGLKMGNVDVIADVSYNNVDNDVQAGNANGVETVKASFDSEAFSLGVTSKMDLKAGYTKISPYAGLRYTHLSVDDYALNGNRNGNLGSYSASSMNIFSLPVGVTISKEFVTDTGWHFKPAVDLHLTANWGDDNIDGTTRWNSANNVNLDTATSAEIIDPFTYGVSAGIAAKKGNFNFGVGLNYTGSENTDELGVQANFRLDF